MSFVIRYHQKVISDYIPKLNGSWKKRIQETLEQRLSISPVLYGKLLRGDFSGCFKLRIGDYQAIYQIQKKDVLIIYIQHRSVMYKNRINNRL